jgi:hypothetical protein
VRERHPPCRDRTWVRHPRVPGGTTRYVGRASGANKIVVGVTGVVFVAFASYIIVMWLLDAFKGRR